MRIFTLYKKKYFYFYQCKSFELTHPNLYVVVIQLHCTYNENVHIRAVRKKALLLLHNKAK
jgi:hypothetical protein